MRLDVPLMDSLREELTLHDHIGLPEALLNIAELVLDVGGDIAANPGVVPPVEAREPEEGRHVLVDDGRVVRHGLGQRQDRREHLVVHVNQGQGVLGYMGTACGDRRYRMPLVQGRPVRHDVLGHQPHVSAGEHQVEILIANDRNVGCCHHGENARERLRPARIDGPDARVGVRAPQDPPVEHAGKPDVGPVPGLAGDLLRAIVADGPRADDGVAAAHPGLFSCGHVAVPRHVRRAASASAPILRAEHAAGRNAARAAARSATA